MKSQEICQKYQIIEFGKIMQYHLVHKQYEFLGNS